MKNGPHLVGLIEDKAGGLGGDHIEDRIGFPTV